MIRLSPFKPAMLALTLGLAACSSVPEQPPTVLPESWFGAASTQPADEQALADWWRHFGDPELTRLVQTAMERNRDVQLAMLRVNSARAQLRQSRAGLFPSLDLPGSASRQWIENDQDIPPDSPLAGLGLDDNLRLDSWELALQATWELDLFGATRARADSARHQVRSAQAQAIAARLAVASNAAQGYIQLRALEAQRALLEEGIDVARDLERISALLFEAGDVTRLDVEATSAERASLEADLGELDINLAEARLALDTLLALPPGSMARDYAAHSPVPLANLSIAPGQPIDLLRRRPDLIAEAARLESSDLQALASRRDLFPRIALQAAVGRSGTYLNNEIGSASNFARLGATFGLPFLDFANRGAAIDLADAERDTAYMTFEQTVANALEEVERGLVRIDGQQRRYRALDTTLRHRERAYDLAQRSYRLGEANLSEVLDAQRGALQARQRALEGRTALATAQVALFVALGGGWQVQSEP
ncbi:efflux transporter outer membrane subunit [Stutzerimonas azotifigens]|uniref:Efflux transporter outer membrane subunit n=1 Tax=Stutzerimonas azotifigens TaxID=291995 RepID=A0ABR5Z5J0_9GAMM|nr:efflux transporter outer membrane subunit [Stutzerimonas azotifigens]MBA1275488.1 efflux transporter outer membrane subunit [Stutzerimonas azotifigens]